MTPRPRPTGWDRVVRRLLPGWFRSAWGRDVIEMLEAERAAARAQGRLALVRFTAATLLDLIRAGWQTRSRGAVTWRYDLRLALRSLRRAPGFTLAAVLTLGLGAAVSTGMFSVLHQVVLQPLPLERPDALLRVRTVMPPAPDLYQVSPVDYDALLRRASTLAGVTYYIPAGLDADVVLKTDEGPERINGLRVAPDYFAVLGVRPAIGPGFTTIGESGPEVVLGHGAWMARYESDPAIVGRAIVVDGRPHTVVGVLPDGFDLPHDGRLPDFWLARRLLPSEREAVDAFVLDLAVRVRPGRSVEEARHEIAAIGRQSAVDQPGGVGERELTAQPLPEFVAAGWTRPLILLAAASAVVLLMACGSVALLVLARQLTRDRELALWVALGASRASIARRLLLEVGLIAIVAMGVGVLLAAWMAQALVVFAPAAVPRFAGIAVNTALWSFVAVVAMTMTVLGGVAGVLRLRAIDTGAGLRSAPRHAAPGGARARGAIVAIECGLMAGLLVALGLALVSFTRLRGVDPGFAPAGRFVLEIGAPQTPGLGRERFARETRFFADVRDRLLGVPEVAAAGAISNLPLTKGWGGQLWIEGKPDQPGPTIDWEVAGPGYFAAAGIDIVRGREFTPGDSADAARVVVINEALANRYFPNQDPIGLSINGESQKGPFRRVVGVVRDVRQQGLHAPPRPQMYIAQGQAFPFGKYQMVVAMRPGADPDGATLRALVRSVDPDGVTGAVRPLADLVESSVAGPRVAMMLVAIFAALAVLLAVTGTWGVVSFVGRSRRQEWAVRSALGASSCHLLWSAARTGFVPAVLGVAAGLTGSLAGGRWLAGQLYGLAAWEPLVFATAIAAVLIISAIVVLLPARRASDVDPASVFRES
jgi:predicted permease